MFLHITLFTGLAAASFGQVGPCSLSQLPVGVIDAHGQPLRGLTAVDFRAHSGRRQLPIKSLDFDDGPRRLVLVVDSAQKLSPETQEAERIMVEAIVAAVRQQDSVALVTARGTEHTIGFGEERNSLVKALGAQEPAGHRQDGGVLDSVLRAIDLLGAPQSGDAIVVIAQDLQDNRNTSAKKLARLVAARRIRIFGLALGPVLTENLAASTMHWGTTRTLPYAGDSPYQAGDEDFYPLARDSGGVVIGATNFKLLTSSNMNDPAFQASLKQKARNIFDLVASYYRLELDRPITGRWNLEVSDAVHKSIPKMFLLYPHELAPCAK